MFNEFGIIDSNIMQISDKDVAGSDEFQWSANDDTSRTYFSRLSNLYYYSLAHK